jgi:hypothetical protein
LVFPGSGVSAQDRPARDGLVPAGPGSLPTAAEIESVMQELSAITGFPVKKRLAFEMVTREQVNRYLKDQIRHSVKPDEIRAEEITLKKFGFVPPDFDLKKNTIDLLTEQAAAFYDFHRKKLFISDWAAENMRDAALIHELGHALADQSFPLEKYLGPGNDDSEDSAARESVVEGQASWLMLEVAARRAGRTLKDPATAGELLKPDDTGSDDKQYPVFSNAPLYIRETLMFPYDEGERFQQAVFLRDGQNAFAEVFRKPPTTTSQILHPERYFAGTAGTTPELPKPAPHTKAFVSGAVGELDERILLRQYLDREAADTLAPKLKGAAYRIDESKPDRRMTLIYLSEWDDEAAASLYFDDYQKVLRGKWKQCQITSETPGRLAGKSEDGYFAVTRTGRRVLSREGFAQALD